MTTFCLTKMGVPLLGYDVWLEKHKGHILMYSDNYLQGNARTRMLHKRHGGPIALENRSLQTY